MTLTIREAVPEDLPQVLEMIAQLARHHGDEPTIRLGVLQNLVFDQGLARILVAAEEEGLVGYALILLRPNLVSGGVGHDINHLFVTEWRRRGGIGRALIAVAREGAMRAGAEFLRIGTHSGNPGAQMAYRDMGLQELPVPGPRFQVALA
mgnify:CR=1 FL=1